MVYKTVFWGSLLFLWYTFIGYPMVLLVISRLNIRNIARNANRKPLPRLSLIISAYNEEVIIEEKILNSLSLTYPKDLMEIIVVSDGSQDKTEEIVGKYFERGVKLQSFEERNGKSTCLNRTVPSAKGVIIVFSDANSMFDANALEYLARAFEEKRTGFVTGHTKYLVDSRNRIAESVGAYSRLESIIKNMESMLGVCIGADGAIFAIRKELFQELRDEDINDLVIPLNILRKGFWGIQDDRVFCKEKMSENAEGEFKRQVRITNRTIRAVFNNRDLLNPFKYWLLALALFSHKVAKLMMPLVLLVLLFSNILLVQSGMMYLTILVVQSAFYTLAFLTYRKGEIRVIDRLGRYSSSFAMVNAAITIGWWKVIQGENYVKWATTKRKA